MRLSRGTIRLIPIVRIKCGKVAHLNAKKVANKLKLILEGAT